MISFSLTPEPRGTLLKTNSLNKLIKKAWPWTSGGCRNNFQTADHHILHTPQHACWNEMYSEQ